MSQLKNRLQALTLLDRAFGTITDEELAAIVATLPEDHVSALDELCGAREGGFTDVAARNIAMRATAARGRMGGELEQLCVLLCDPCLEKCVDILGDDSEDPTEDQLLKATPKLIKALANNNFMAKRWKEWEEKFGQKPRDKDGMVIY